MKIFTHWLIVLLILGAAQLSACSPKPAANEKVQPVQLEEIDGSDIKRVILTEKAAERIDVQTVVVNGKVIPYSAVIYDTSGNTWVYVSSAPLTFVRQSIVIDHIDGDRVILLQGPDANSAVVTVGVSELYGAETGVSK